MTLLLFFTWCDPRLLRGRRSVRMRTAPQCRESLPLGASFTSTWKPIPRSAGAVTSLSYVSFPGPTRRAGWTSPAPPSTSTRCRGPLPPPWGSRRAPSTCPSGGLVELLGERCETFFDGWVFYPISRIPDLECLSACCSLCSGCLQTGQAGEFGCFVESK